MSGKSQQAGESYNYFGTVAGVVRMGQIDVLHAVLVDGVPLWEGTLNRGHQTASDLSVDPKWFPRRGGGYVRLYWGTSAQTADAALSGHPAYKGIAYIVLHRFLFGRERTTAPNIEVIASALPVVNTLVVEAADNTLIDGQCNPVAAIAELITHPNLLGVPIARLQGVSWRSTAAWCNANDDRRAASYCSPFVGDDSDAAKIIAELLELFDGGLRHTADGTIAMLPLERGVIPSGLATYDQRQFVDPPQYDCPGWGETPTGVIVAFVDRDRQYKASEEKLDNLATLLMRGSEPDLLKVSRPHVTRRQQASRHGAEMIRHLAQPIPTGRYLVRAATASGLLPGSKVMIDVDPEPGGAGSAQLALVTRVSEKMLGPIEVDAVFNPNVTAVPYAANATPETPEEASAAPIAHALVIPLPPATYGPQPAFAVLATRPENDTVGARVFFGLDAAGDFAEPGDLVGFAARLSLDDAVTDDDTVFEMSLIDGVTSPDAYLAGLTPGGNESIARDDELLAVIANVSSGRVVIDGDGRPEMEIVSIVARSAVDADTHEYTVLRGRRGLPPRAWTTGAQVWVFPGANLVAWRHPDLVAMTISGVIGYVRLQSFTAYASDDSAPLPERSFYIPAAFDVAPKISWLDPVASTAEADYSSGDIDIEIEVLDRDSDLISLRLDSVRADGSSPVNHANRSFAPAALYEYAATLNFAVGTYELTATASDRAGNIVQSRRTVIRNAGAGGLLPPVFNPAGVIFTGTLEVNISVASPADRIEYAVLSPGSAAPSSGTLYVGTSVDVSISSSRRLWARAGNGTDWTFWISADYERETLGGGGIVP